MDALRKCKHDGKLLREHCRIIFDLQTNESQMFLRNSEKFALLVAQNLDEDEPSLTIESQNIGKVYHKI